MYKVFFNDRIINLDDTLPNMDKVGKDYVCAFENITDLKPQVKQFLEPDKKGNLYIFHDDEKSLFRTFRQCFETIIAGGGIVKNANGEILMIYRRGKWDLPKGKPEPGESIEDTSIREVEEECGLKGIEIQELLGSTYHIYEDANRHVLKQTDWFAMKYTGGSLPSPQVSEEITDVKWVGPSDLEKILSNTFPSLIELIQASLK